MRRALNRTVWVVINENTRSEIMRTAHGRLRPQVGADPRSDLPDRSGILTCARSMYERLGDAKGRMPTEPPSRLSVGNFSVATGTPKGATPE